MAQEQIFYRQDDVNSTVMTVDTVATPGHLAVSVIFDEEMSLTRDDVIELHRVLGEFLERNPA